MPEDLDPNEDPIEDPAEGRPSAKDGETPQEDPAGKGGEKPKNWQNEAEKNARLLRRTEKELETLRAEKQQREDAEKTEAQKATDRATAAEHRAAKLERDLWVRDAATANGLTSDDYEFIQADTKEEIDERAQRLSARIKPGEGDEKGKDGKTKPRPMGGGDGNPKVPDEDAADKNRKASLVSRFGIPGVKTDQK
jgi:hypothetical protein